MTPLRFLFDFISPYAYVAWARLPAIAAKHGRELTLEPVLFAAVLDALGTKGPAEVPARRGFAYKDAARKAARAGLPPLVPPPAHPFNSLLALRLIAVAPATERPAMTTAIFQRCWADGQSIADDAGVRAALAAVPGLDLDALAAAATTREAKASLRDATAAAIACGVFGVPTVVVDGELFFGVDNLDALDDFLGGRDPVDPRLVERWRTLPVGAQRAVMTPTPE